MSDTKMRIRAIGDIIKEVCALPNFDKAKKIEILRKNDHPGLRSFLVHLFDPNIDWALPEGAPPYTPNKQLDCDGQLYKELKRLYLFTKSGAPDLKQLRRELLFVQLLEAVTPNDAELLIAMVNHKPPKGITWKLVQEAYGG